MNSATRLQSSLILFVVALLTSLSAYAEDAFTAKQGGVTRSSLKLYGGTVSSLRIGSNGNLAASFGSANGIFCSGDGGTNWIAPPAGSDFGLISDVTFGDNPQTVYMIAGTSLQKSTDFCGTWTALEGDNYDQCMLYAHGTLLAAVRDGIVAYSTDGGATITNSTVGSGLGRVRALGASATAGTFYLLIQIAENSATTALYKSTDGAVTWSPMNKSGSYLNVFGHPTDPDKLVVLGNAGGEITENGGTTWSDLGLSVAVSTVAWSGNRFYVGASYREEGDETWHGFTALSGTTYDSSILGWITPDPLTPNLLYASSERGVAKSTDNGLTWHDYVSGLYAVSVHDIFQATDKNIVYLAVTGGLAKTANYTDTANVSWTQVSIGEQGSTAWSVFARKDDPSKILVGSANEIYHSEDSGTSWAESSSPLLNGEDVYDFQELPDGRIAGAFHDRDTCNGGVIVSSDDGLTWTPLSSGGYVAPSNAMTVLGQDLYVAVGTAYSYLTCTEAQHGVYRYDGSSWTQLGGLSNKYADDIITAGSNLFVSVGERTNVHNSAVYRSKDAGETWEAMEFQFGEGDRGYFQSLASDGANSQIVYAASGHPNGNGTIFRSADGGDSWLAYYTTLKDEVPQAMFVDDLAAGFGTGLFGFTGNATPYRVVSRLAGRPAVLSCTLLKNGRVQRNKRLRVMSRGRNQTSFRRAAVDVTDSRGQISYSLLRRRTAYRCSFRDPQGRLISSRIRNRR